MHAPLPEQARTPVEIDGSFGEGGGQVLRSALALSLCTGRPLRIHSIRAGRSKPGLMRQHLTAVELATEVGDAEVSGAEVGSKEIRFTPRSPARAGCYRRAIGTAGSTTLVAQTVLPALLCADAPSELVLSGGTHNPLAPPADFLERSFLPALRRLGADVDFELRRHGFHPAGGGEIVLRVRPSALRPAEWSRRGAVKAIRVCALVAGLAEHVGRREVDVVRDRLGLAADRVQVRSLPNGPGNALLVDVECESGTEVFCAFGRLGLPAERVGAEAVRAVKAHLRHDAPIGEHLADQLLLPLALAGGGSFRTARPSMHTTTNARVIEAFLSIAVTMREDGDGTWRVDVAPR